MLDGEVRYRPRLVAPPPGYEVSGPPPATWLEVEIGARLPRRRVPSDAYGKPLRLGEHMVLRVRSGYRAAVQDLGNGQYLVSIVPDAALEPKMGILPLLAPAMIVQAVKKLLPQKAAADRKLDEHRQVDDEPEPRRLLPARRHADDEWLDDGSQMAGCGCGCRSCRSQERY